MLKLHSTELEQCHKLRKRERQVRIFLLRDVTSCGILSSSSLQELQQQLLAHIPVALETSCLHVSFHGPHTRLN